MSSTSSQCPAAPTLPRYLGIAHLEVGSLIIRCCCWQYRGFFEQSMLTARPNITASSKCYTTGIPVSPLHRAAPASRPASPVAAVTRRVSQQRATMSKEPRLMGKHVSWDELCQEALQQPVKSVQHKSIARLWSGYGSIQEVTAVTQDGQQHKLIVKQVDPPQERGVSHERKLKSYAAEAAFYSTYVSRVLECGGAAAVAEALLVDVSPPTHFLLVLTDLRVDYPQHRYTLGKEDAQAALEWLAAFHALWWEEVPGQQCPVSHSSPFSITAGSTAKKQQQQPGQGPTPAPPTSLWDQGCYWHLDTRQQEFQSTPRSWADLRAAADRVDAVLKGQRSDGSLTSCNQTLVHGDFKSENLLWNSGGMCCAYDFQYVGKGLGVRDIAYMLASSVDIDVLLEEGGEQQLLQHYHSALTKQLTKHGKAAAAQRYGYEIMVAQFELCLVDYVRFMAGWGMWGNAEWASDRAREILQGIDQVIARARTGW